MPRLEQSDTLEQVGIILQSRPEDKSKRIIAVIKPATPTYKLISIFFSEYAHNHVVLWSHPCGSHISDVAGINSLFEITHQWIRHDSDIDLSSDISRW